MSAYSILYWVMHEIRETAKHKHLDGVIADDMNAWADAIDFLLRDEIEPTEEDQGLIPIPQGYNEQ